MATHLDLEEQEQIDQLKHFWNRWGNLITWALILVLGAYAAWSGWQYWQRRQGELASALYEQVQRSATDGDLERLQRAQSDLKDKYGGTTYAAYGGLLAGKTLAENDKPEEAKAVFSWVADKASDEGLRASARLRLASLQLNEKAYDEALKTLSASFPASYTAIVADRRGDVYMLQGKRAEAVTEYGKAYQGLKGEGGYRQLVGMKLNALGIQPGGAGGAGKAAS